MRRRHTTPEGVLLLEPQLGRRWTTTAAAIFVVGMCLILSARGVASAIQGRPQLLLLTLFGIVGCAIVLKHCVDTVAATGRIAISRATASIRFTGLKAAARAALDAPSSGPVDLSFDAVERVDAHRDSTRSGSRWRVALLLGSPNDLALTVDDGLSLHQAQTLVEALRQSMDIGERSAQPKSDAPAASSAEPPPRWKYLQTFFVVLAAFGAATFLAGFVTSVVPMPFLDTVELPLGAPAGLLEDNEGRIVVGSRSYLRLQRYLPDGRFDRAWRAPEVKGEWRLAVAENGDYVLRSMPSGCWTITEQEVTGPARCADGLSFGGFTTASGLEIQSWPFRVIRGSHVIVSQSVVLNLIRSPLPAFVWLVIGIAGQLWLRGRPPEENGGPE